MKLLFSYLKKRRVGIIFYFLFTVINFGVFFLYELPVNGPVYACVITCTVFLLYGMFDFWRYAKKVHFMECMMCQKRIDGEKFLLAEDGIEKTYQDIILRLLEEKKDMESSIRIARQEMKDYYGMWAHQIKTPIAAIRVMLQSENFSFNDMKQEIFKIEQYVEMVLTYLRMEEMSTDLRFERYSLDHIVKHAIRKYSQMFILKKIRLEYQPLNMDVLTDEKWLTFVLEQILSNALKYTREGSICIKMEDGNLVIQDTGIGIWPEDLPRVFERGFTGYNGRYDKKSTGIGLYLCKCILDKLEHPVWIESEVDKGTTVFIHLERN